MTVHKGESLLQRVGERIGAVGLGVVTLAAAAVGRVRRGRKAGRAGFRIVAVIGAVVAALLGMAVLAGCKPVEGSPSPRAPYSEDADKPDYTCGYDGNRRCPPDGSVNR